MSKIYTKNREIKYKIVKIIYKILLCKYFILTKLSRNFLNMYIIDDVCIQEHYFYSYSLQNIKKKHKRFRKIKKNQV